METAVKSSEVFNFVHKALEKLLEYFSDETKQNPEHLARGFQQISILWEKKIALLTHFSEKGQILVFVIRFFCHVSPESQDFSEPFVDKILSKYIPETLDLLNGRPVQDENTLCEVQEVLLQLTKLCNVISLPKTHQKSLFLLILKYSFAHRSFLSTSENQWMDEFVDYLCIQIKFYLNKVLQDPNNAEFLDWLRILNTKLMDLAKIFPNEAFRGTKYVVRVVTSVYKMMNCGLDDRIIQTSAVVPLLGIVEQIKGNDEFYNAIYDSVIDERPALILPFLSEIVQIIAKNPCLDDFFGSNLFKILFDATIQQNEVTSGTLTPLVTCLTLSTSNETAFETSVSRLIKALMSENVFEAYLSVNIWIFVARICSKETCYEYFEQLREVFSTFPESSRNPQKYFVAKTMKFFYLCLKNKMKMKVQEDYPLENNVELWIELGLNNLKKNSVVENVFERTRNKITEFLMDGDLQKYHEIVQCLELCSTVFPPNFTPQPIFFETIDDILDFLVHNSSNSEAFESLTNSVIKFCDTYVDDINLVSLSNLLFLIKSIKNSLYHHLIQRIVNQRGKSMNETLRNDFERLLHELPKIPETNEVETLLHNAGYSTDSERHVCFNTPMDDNDTEDDEIFNSPEAKRPKIDCYSPNKRQALDNLLIFEQQLTDSGILMSIPELETHVREMKTLLS